MLPNLLLVCVDGFHNFDDHRLGIEAITNQPDARLAGHGGHECRVEPAQHLVARLGRAHAVLVLEVVDDDVVGRLRQVLDAAEALPGALGLNTDAVGQHDLVVGPRRGGFQDAERLLQIVVVLDLVLDRLQALARAFVGRTDEEAVPELGQAGLHDRPLLGHDRRLRRLAERLDHDAGVWPMRRLDHLFLKRRCRQRMAVAEQVLMRAHAIVLDRAQQL